MASTVHFNPPGVSRRSFLKASALLAGSAPLSGVIEAQPSGGKAPLMAYVGTFSSPLRDVLPTQVDLPPGNGRGIHLFQVDRATGAMTPSGVYELGTSPSCLALNAAGTRLYSPTRRTGVGEGKEGTVSAFAINRADGQLTAAQHRPFRRGGSHLRERPSVRAGSCWWPTTSAAPWRCCRFCLTAAWGPPPTSSRMPARWDRERPPTPRREASPSADTTERMRT